MQFQRIVKWTINIAFLPSVTRFLHLNYYNISDRDRLVKIFHPVLINRVPLTESMIADYNYYDRVAFVNKGS